MRIAKFEKVFPRVLKTVCFTLFLLALCTTVWAQSQNWWVLPSSGAAERGKIDEIKNLRKVYLIVTFDSSGAGQITNTTEQADIRKNVEDAFKATEGITI